MTGRPRDRRRGWHSWWPGTRNAEPRRDAEPCRDASPEPLNEDGVDDDRAVAHEQTNAHAHEQAYDCAFDDTRNHPHEEAFAHALHDEDESEWARERRFRRELAVKTAALRAAYERDLRNVLQPTGEERYTLRLVRQAAGVDLPLDDAWEEDEGALDDLVSAPARGGSVPATCPGVDCPEPAVLIAMRDGEGDLAENARALLHIEACPHCSQFLWMSDEMLFLAGEEMRTPIPPRTRIVDFADEARRRRNAYRQAPIVQPIPAGLRPWFPHASAAICAVLVFALIVHNASVSLRADALLARALQQEHVRGDHVAPPRMRGGWKVTRRFGREQRPPAEYGPAGVMREIGSRGAALAPPFVPAPAQPFADGAPLDAATARLLAFHQFDPANPFSVSHFRRWRASLPAKSDRLLLTGDMHRLLRVTTSDGQLREAEIEFRDGTLEVARVAFVFEGLGRLEFHSVEQWPVRERRATRALVEVVRRPALRPEEMAALEVAELDIRMELRLSELDLDNSVDVARVDDGLLVKLPATPAARLLEPALEAVSPRVRIQRTGDPSRAAEPARVVIGGRTGVKAPAFAGWTVNPTNRAVRAKDVVQDEREPGTAERPWMERWQELAFANSPQERVAFSTELVREVAQAERLTELLKRLASRYSPRDIDRMPPATRIKLQRLVSLQHEALVRALQQVGYRLAAVGRFTTVTPAFACEPRVSDPSWRRVTTRGPDRAKTLRESIRRLVREKNPALDAEGQCDLTQIDRDFLLLWDAVNGSRVCGG